MTTDANTTQISGDGGGGGVAAAAPRGEEPAALTVEQLSAAVGLPVETVRRHLESGAPTGTDGRVNLIHYAAWLNKRLAQMASIDGRQSDGD